METPMLTNSQAREIVESSLAKTTGGVTPRGGSLRAAGFTDDKLKSLVITLVSDPTAGVARFQHVLDPNIVGDVGLDTTIEELTGKVLRLSAGKLCSNPTNPHDQTCCPYPTTCPVCGYPVR